MSLTYNNTAVKKITLNGDDVKHLDYNGTRTWDAYRTMTVYIDESNPDPETCCTYGDDAVGMTPGSDEWDEFFGHYPVMLKDGVEGQKLQRNDFTKHEDGTAADITTGAEGDVMICFPLRQLKIRTVNGLLAITMSDNLEESSPFCYLGHIKRWTYNSRTTTTVVKKFYVGAYRSAGRDCRYFESLSDKEIVKYQSYTNREVLSNRMKNDGQYRTYYGDLSITFLTYIKAMYILKYKSLDSNNVIGCSRIHAYKKLSDDLITGTLNKKGMDYKNINLQTTHHMKLFGMEDFIGEQCCIRGIIPRPFPKDAVIASNYNTYSQENIGYAPMQVCSSDYNMTMAGRARGLTDYESLDYSYGWLLPYRGSSTDKSCWGANYRWDPSDTNDILVTSYDIINSPPTRNIFSIGYLSQNGLDSKHYIDFAQRLSYPSALNSAPIYLIDTSKEKTI